MTILLPPTMRIAVTPGVKLHTWRHVSVSKMAISEFKSTNCLHCVYAKETILAGLAYATIGTAV